MGVLLQSNPIEGRAERRSNYSANHVAQEAPGLRVVGTDVSDDHYQ